MFTFYTVLFLIASSIFVKCDDLEELKQKYAQMIMDCAQEYPIDPTDIEQLKTRQMPDKESVKCLFACAYKKSGVMSEDGLLSVEGTNKLAETYLANDPERLKKAKDFTEACKFVNDEAVSDGNKGCERAALMFKCSTEKAAEALTDEEIKADFSKTVIKCSKNYKANMQDLLSLATLTVPTDPEVKCILACAYREKGTMDAKGMYDVAGAYKFAEENLKGEEKRIKRAKEFADLCATVNYEKVGDGDKGCERAALMFKCSIKNAAKYGFKV
ncbi:unnamed protein product [Leptosia nina]|uniref:Odorant-binding protein n=1 Tax=Leptosia nina TaxID=320188 RepID=A0AAV1J1Q2_9NEOP